MIEIKKAFARFRYLQIGADSQEAGNHERGDGNKDSSFPDASMHREWFNDSSIQRSHISGQRYVPKSRNGTQS